MQDLRLILLVIGVVFIALLVLHGIWSSKKEKQSKFSQAKKRTAWEKKESRTRAIQQEIQHTPVPPTLEQQGASPISKFSEDSMATKLPIYGEDQAMNQKRSSSSNGKVETTPGFLSKIKNIVIKDKTPGAFVKSIQEQQRLLDEAFNVQPDMEVPILPEDYQPPRRSVIEDPLIKQPMDPELLRSLQVEKESSNETPSMLIRRHETSSIYHSETVNIHPKPLKTQRSDPLLDGGVDKEKEAVIPRAFNTDRTIDRIKDPKIEDAQPLEVKQEEKRSSIETEILTNKASNVKIEPTMDPPLVAAHNYDEQMAIEVGSPMTATRHPENTQPKDPQKVSEQAKAQPMDSCIIHVQAFNNELYNGKVLIDCMLRHGLRFGKMGMYHRFINPEEDNSEPIFSVANMIAPGTFTVKRLEDLETPGLSFFMLLPCQGDAERYFKLMLETAQQIASDLGGSVLDEARYLITPQKLADYKAKIKRYSYASNSVRSKLE